MTHFSIRTLTATGLAASLALASFTMPAEAGKITGTIGGGITITSHGHYAPPPVFYPPIYPFFGFGFAPAPVYPRPVYPAPYPRPATPRPVTPRPVTPHPVKPQPSRALPGKCQFTVRYGHDAGSYFGRTCLNRNYPAAYALPRACAERVNVPGKAPVMGYETSCLARYGYKPAYHPVRH